MSISEILLLAFLLSGFFGIAVFAIIDQWKRTQAYNGVMEALEGSIVTIADSLSDIAFEMTVARIASKCHEKIEDTKS